MESTSQRKDSLLNEAMKKPEFSTGRTWTKWITVCYIIARCIDPLLSSMYFGMESFSVSSIVALCAGIVIALLGYFYGLTKYFGFWLILNAVSAGINIYLLWYNYGNNMQYVLKIPPVLYMIFMMVICVVCAGLLLFKRDIREYGERMYQIRKQVAEFRLASTKNNSF